MADSNSSLPVKTLNNGDVAAKIVDGTITSQALSVDSAGRITSKTNDGLGNPITSQANGAQQALDVGIDVAGVQIDPRQIRALTSADVVTANQGAPNTATNGWPVKPTDGTNSQSFTAAGEAKVDITQPLPAGSNNIGSVNQGTSPWLTKDAADGPVTPGTVAGNSILVGAQFNTSLPTLTAAQQAALQVTAKGELITIQDVGGAPISSTNPLPVVLSAGVSGSVVNNYNMATAIAAGASSTHTYTITTGKSLQGKKIWASSIGAMKIEVQTSPDGVTWSSIFVGFNSTATPNIDINMDEILFLQSAGTGAGVRIIRTNEEVSLAENLYSTISGVEV
jgi:hypothetical protein